jgi:hypothetical protein
MSFFVFPQAWIAPAIAAASMAFGPIGTQVHIKYHNLSGQTLGEAKPPSTIYIDKRPASQWPREKAQCVIAHEFGHLSGFSDPSNKADPSHSDNPNSIMYATLLYKPCHRWLVNHGLSG